MLREAFDYPYRQIAEILGTSDAHTRQVVSRARKHLSSQRRERDGAAAHRRLLEAFVTAAQTGDLSALEDVLTADVVSYADGGGMRGASRIPVVGRPHVAKYVAAFAPRFWPGANVRWVEANGLPAALVSARGTAVALLSVDVSARGVERLTWVLNPAKLSAYASYAASSDR